MTEEISGLKRKADVKDTCEDEVCQARKVLDGRPSPQARKARTAFFTCVQIVLLCPVSGSSTKRTRACHLKPRRRTVDMLPLFYGSNTTSLDMRPGSLTLMPRESVVAVV